MLSSLKGIEVLIGREPNKGCLQLFLKYNDVQKSALLGGEQSVPKSVSRCLPNESTAHCKLFFDPNGKIYIRNIKPENVTFVNGYEVMSMCVDLKSEIALGKDKYVLPLERVLEIVLKQVGEIRVMQPLSIAHLEEVWNTYEEQCDKIAKKAQQRNKLRMAPMLIAGISTVLGRLFQSSPNTSSIYHNVAYGISIISVIVMLYLFTSKDTSTADRKKAKDKLIGNYVCPNPSCKHFLGEVPYKVLRQNKKCQYCGVPWKINFKI